MISAWNLYDDYSWGGYPVYFDSPGEDYLKPPSTPGGSGARISIPSKTIEIPGVGSVVIGGGTWDIDPSRPSTGSREAATAITNQYEQVFQRNLQAYQTKQISASQALQNFDTIWAQYVSALDAVGAAEKAAAIGDRQRGGKFDWFRAYRDTIGSAVPGLPAPPVGGLADFLQRNLLIIALIIGGLWFVSKK